MAMTAYLDVDQGSDFIISISLQNDDGTIMDLTGFSIYSQFRKSFGSTTAYAFNAQIPDPTNGILTLALSGTSSSAIKPGRYLYDVEIVLDRLKTRVVEGIVTINPEITKIP
jgi:hypothetical protein